MKIQRFNELNENVVNKIKVCTKGYTLEVKSCENDGDHSKTKRHTVQNKKDAEILYKICKELFVSCNNGEGGVGNSFEDDSPTQTIADYIEDNPDVLELEYRDGVKIKDQIETWKEDDYLDTIHDIFLDISYYLMGGSEVYEFRVCDSVKCWYSPEDVYLQEITF